MNSIKMKEIFKKEIKKILNLASFHSNKSIAKQQWEFVQSRFQVSEPKTSNDQAVDDQVSTEDSDDLPNQI